MEVWSCFQGRHHHHHRHHEDDDDHYHHHWPVFSSPVPCFVLHTLVPTDDYTIEFGLSLDNSAHIWIQTAPGFSWLCIISTQAHSNATFPKRLTTWWLIRLYKTEGFVCPSLWMHLFVDAGDHKSPKTHLSLALHLCSSASLVFLGLTDVFDYCLTICTAFAAFCVEYIFKSKG